ncbi:heme NO-binding domain-containing protein [Roseobacter sp. YSTF-M11]|uniref:Heme NO-binding domain-containing protein n=1 Tax=Roseobacter insulae TaxID=2859783 RepID=A0A9X1FW55_9RHOB|nr:heme NO-binding domain-containing protein [Roseobacter insulae]MBW4708469.1 heme NO-binding domain-containing protein [Roseobacter insulae]
MHGLVNRAIQRFVIDSYGAAQWSASAQRANLNFVDFEAMWFYDDEITPRLLAAVCDVLDRPYDELMEDIGTYLVSHPNVEALRRLLRFGGVNFVEFLHSLDDLPDRARLAVPDLTLPSLELREHSANTYSLCCRSELPGGGHLFTGVLRAMADDYGALVFLEHQGTDDGVETVSISLLETDFAEGRGFDLGVRSE